MKVNRILKTIFFVIQMKILTLTKRVIIIVAIMSGALFAQNTAPVVSNVNFNMRNDGSKIVDITYDVNDAQGQTMTVTIAASSDSGASWNLPITQVTGAVGSSITNGTGKTIVWNAGAEIPNFYSSTVQIRITADDGVFPCGSQITYAGKTYNTVQIGSQCWLKENLNVGVYVPSVYTGSSHSDVSNNGIIEKYCYNNDTTNCNIYGGLYDWNEAMEYVSTPGAKGICPSGWHIPTKIELQTLLSAVGDNGNALKAVGQGTGFGAGTNTSGFSALLTGYRGYYGGFMEIDRYANFWSSSEYNASNAKYMLLYYNDSSVGFSYYSKMNGFSVRCSKD